MDLNASSGVLDKGFLRGMRNRHSRRVLKRKKKERKERRGRGVGEKGEIWMERGRESRRMA